MTDDPIDCKVMTCLDEQVLSSARKWGRYAMYDPLTGRSCLLGGLKAAVSREFADKNTEHEIRRAREVYKRLRDLIATEIKPGNCTASSTIIVTFNDSADHKFRDVKKVIKAVRSKVCDE